MKLSEIVAGFLENMPAGLVVPQETVQRSLKKTVRFYCGFATIRSLELADGEIHTPIDASDSIAGTQDFDLNASEYAIIRPLFELYVEHENATHLEASRGLGVDVYGRSVSEIQQEIMQREMDFPKLSFMEPPVTV